MACPGVGADHSAGAGEALSAGEARTGDILLIGVDIMIRSGEDTTVTHIGDMVAVIGVTITTTDPIT